jgi:hypothetical protein
LVTCPLRAKHLGAVGPDSFTSSRLVLDLGITWMVDVDTPGSACPQDDALGNHWNRAAASSQVASGGQGHCHLGLGSMGCQGLCHVGLGLMGKRALATKGASGGQARQQTNYQKHITFSSITVLLPPQASLDFPSSLLRSPFLSSELL